MQAEKFIAIDTVKILLLGLFAFILDTAGGVMFVKILNIFLRKKINPMIGAAGISAFPMSARVIQKLALEEDNQNYLLMHAVSANVSGQIASVAASGLVLSLIMRFL
jgi:oxaloacetate decarboxylase beta subunit